MQGSNRTIRATTLSGQPLGNESERMAIHLHSKDLPPGVRFGKSVAVDTETLGLAPQRDALCLVQLSGGDGDAHLVQLERRNWRAPRLKALLADQSVTKIFHYARFDIATLKQHLGVEVQPLWCTKVASKLARTYSGHHGLKDVCRELLGVDLSKQQQNSDWGGSLSQAQQAYAANDVLHLHALQSKLHAMLKREGRLALAEACFAMIPIWAELDLRGWNGHEVFAH